MMDIDANNMGNLDTEVEKNEEPSTALGNTNEKKAESEVNESHNAFEQVYFCTKCNEKFPKELYLEAHVYMRHGRGKIFNCPHCDRTFDDKGSLKVHEKSHPAIRTFSCSA